MVACPLCEGDFPESEIEEHASECDPEAASRCEADLALALRLSAQPQQPPHEPQEPDTAQETPQQRQRQGHREQPHSSPPQALQPKKRQPPRPQQPATRKAQSPPRSKRKVSAARVEDTSRQKLTAGKHGPQALRDVLRTAGRARAARAKHNSSTTNTNAAADKAPKPVDEKAVKPKNGQAVPGQWTFLTFNVWFDNKQLHTRMTEVGRIISAENPHFVALQEVTPIILDIFKTQPWWSSYYFYKEPKGAPYFVMLGTKVRPADMRRIPYQNSVMGRDLSIAAVPLPGAGEPTKLTLACSHLESGRSYREQRGKQLRAALDILSKKKQGSENAVFMGDFNMSGQEGKEVISDLGWTDAWLAVPGNTEKNGHTMDSTLNSNLGSRKRAYRTRLDRILFRTTEMRLVSIARLALDVCPGTQVHPSDHFALLAKFALLE